MNKYDLVKLIAADAETSQTEAALILDSALNVIMDCVAKGEKIQLLGFGSFENKHRSARVGRNPSTGEVVEIPETYAPVFKAGREFKDMVIRSANKRQ